MDQSELAENMRGRIRLCRNLAASTSDGQTRAELLKMAEEGERDLQRLMSREGSRSSSDD
jgi:hypothetical protein